MAADEKANWSLIDFARQVAGAPQGLVESNFSEPGLDEAALVIPGETALVPAATAVKGDHKFPEIPPPMRDDQDAVPADLPEAQPVMSPQYQGKKQLRTPNEIAGIILDTLRKIDGRAGRGFIVTVYGSNPWNAMLTIRPEAGPGIDRALWISRTNDISVTLREHFDVTQ